jgi:hypothetical protein
MSIGSIKRLRGLLLLAQTLVARARQRRRLVSCHGRDHDDGGADDRLHVKWLVNKCSRQAASGWGAASGHRPVSGHSSGGGGGDAGSRTRQRIEVSAPISSLHNVLGVPEDAGAHEDLGFSLWPQH